MSKLHETLSSPYSPRQIFDLVADIEKYPEFLPWCRAARILRKPTDNTVEAELVINFKHFQESYISRVTFTPPERIDVEMIQGPFHHLTNRWMFTPKPEGGCQIEFFLDFQFRSKLLDKLIGAMFGRAQAKMLAAFQDRADKLYAQTK